LTAVLAPASIVISESLKNPCGNGPIKCDGDNPGRSTLENLSSDSRHRVTSRHGVIYQQNLNAAQLLGDFSTEFIFRINDDATLNLHARPS
jgi:hypothetical protein